MSISLRYNRDDPPLTANLTSKWGTVSSDALYGYDVQQAIMRPNPLKQSFSIIGDHRLSGLLQSSMNPNLNTFQTIYSNKPVAYTTALQAGPLKYSSQNACLQGYPRNSVTRQMGCENAMF